MNHMNLELYNGVISRNHEVLMAIKDMDSADVVDQITPTKYTILHLATEFGNLGCVAEILSAHPSVLLKVNSRGETALHLAARTGDYGVAKALINAAKSSDLQVDHAQNGSPTVVEFLIRAINVESDTALHEAVRYNHLNVVELLVKEDPSHPHPPNMNAETPLFMASRKAYNDIVKVILDNCLSPTSDGPCGQTALHAAILSGTSSGGIKLLLEKKPDLVKVTDDNGWTSFHYAATRNYPGLISALIDADKCMAYLPDTRYKRIALHVAAYLGNVKVTKELLKHCPDSYDITDGSGSNILHIAVEQNNKNFVRYIMTDCKGVNNLLLQKNKEGNTPLHVMAIFGCYVPEVFNHNQLYWEALNSQNRTPYDLTYKWHPADYVGDQKKLRAKQPKEYYVNCNEYLDRIMEEQGYETGQLLSNYNKEIKLDMEKIGKVRDTHMIVAALIATVALAAGFAMPGGFDGNAGPNQGSPALLKSSAFTLFVVTDTLALGFSMSALFIYFISVFLYNPKGVKYLAFASTILNILSIESMMLAFITGTAAVLHHKKALASVVMILAFFFVPLMVYVPLMVLNRGDKIFLLEKLPWNMQYLY